MASSGKICAYFRCGKSSRNHPGLRKFSFPIAEPKRCHEWVKNSGNETLKGLDPDMLKKQFLCQYHFKPEELLTKNLSKTAIPLKYLTAEETVQEEIPKKTRTYPSESSQSDPIPSTSGLQSKFNRSGELLIITPSKPQKPREISPTDNFSDDSDWGEDFSLLEKIPENVQLRADTSNTPRKRKLNKKISFLKKKLRSKTSQLSQVRKSGLGAQNRKIGAGFSPRNLNSLPLFARALVKMQLYHKARMPFSNEEKKVSISMFYKSPGLYRFLRRNGVVLPSESSIKMWITDFNAKAGFDKILLNRINQKVSTMSESEKQCILMFDEMDIKEFLDYSRKLDMVEGFEDLGEFGRRSVLAKKVLVLMVRGIYSQWKLPIAYFLSEKPISAEKLKDIMTLAVKKISDTSLKLIATVCDQSTTNQKLYRLLNVSVTNPFFVTENKKVYALFDAPHLIKSLRNNLLNGYFIYANKIVSFEAVMKLVELDRKSVTGKALPKITDKHLRPNNFEKMNVKLATQIFSNSVAGALKTAVRTGELKDKTALATAEFTELVDKLFDALNSQTLYAIKPWNSALSNSNLHAQDALQQGFKLFTILVKKDIKTGILSRPPCFNGILQTINAVNSVFRNSLDNGYSFLLTRRLNQDPLENQFSLYRQSGGYNRNPTVRTFKAAFKMSTTINLIKPPHSNCEADEDRNILLDSEEKVGIIDEPSSSSSSPSSSDTVVSGDFGNESFNLERSAIVYFAGYLLKKVLNKYKCELCQAFLQDNLNEELDENHSLIFFKNYWIDQSSFCRLKVPSPILKTFTEVSMRYFSKYLKKYWVKPGFGKHIQKLLIKKLQLLVPDWFIQNECEDHRKFILEILVRTLIFKECRNHSLNIKAHGTSKTSKKFVKLSILQHS